MQTKHATKVKMAPELVVSTKSRGMVRNTSYFRSLSMAFAGLPSNADNPMTVFSVAKIATVKMKLACRFKLDIVKLWWRCRTKYDLEFLGVLVSG